MDAIGQVFRKVQEISKRSMTPRPRIPVAELTAELPDMSLNEYVLPCLTQLKRMRLIEYNSYDAPFVKLTLLGHTMRDR